MCALNSSIFTLLIEVFWFGHGNDSPLVCFSSISLPTFPRTPSSFTDFLFLSVFYPPSFYQTLIFPSCAQFFAYVFLFFLPPTLHSPFTVSLLIPFDLFPFCCSHKDSRYNATFQFVFIQEEGQSKLESQQKTIGNKSRFINSFHLLNAYHGPRIALVALSIFTFNPHNILECFYPHFTDQQMEAQKQNSFFPK